MYLRHFAFARLAFENDPATEGRSSPPHTARPRRASGNASSCAASAC